MKLFLKRSSFWEVKWTIGFTLKTHQMSLRLCRNLKTQQSRQGVTWSSWLHNFRKTLTQTLFGFVTRSSSPTNIYWNKQHIPCPLFAHLQITAADFTPSLGIGWRSRESYFRANWIVLFARADWLARRWLAKYYSPPKRRRKTKWLLSVYCPK